MSCTDFFSIDKLESMCRACLSVGAELESLYENDTAHQFCDCTSLKVYKMDGLSPYLCHPCLRLVQQFYNFRKLCQQSEDIIRNRLSKQDNYLKEYYDVEIVKNEPENTEKNEDENLYEIQNVLNDDKRSIMELLPENVELNEDDSFKYEDDFSDDVYSSIKKENLRIKSRLLKCKICPSVFKHKSHFKKHLRKHFKNHTKNNNSPSKYSAKNNITDADGFNDDNGPIDEKSNELSKKVFQCEICPKVFKCDGNVFENHIKHHDNIKIKSAKRKDNQCNSSQSEKKRSIQFSCIKCDRRFFKQRLYEEHMRSHDGLPESSVSCTVCNKVLKHRSLPKHMSLHDVEKKYKCPSCDKAYTTKSSLNIHEQTHSGSAKFVCDICGHKSSQICQFKNHITKHTGEKPYYCEVCEKRFRYSSELRLHRMRHQGVKNFFCADCPMSFCVKRDLISHTKTHSDLKTYACGICDKTFKSRTFVSVHRRSHTGERPFECDLCPLKFTRGSYLRRHRMTHTGEKPKKCSLCGQGFIQKCALNNHMKIHHKKPTTVSQ